VIVQKDQAEWQAGPFTVGVEIKIDAKEHTPQEIGEIVRQVREAQAQGRGGVRLRTTSSRGRDPPCPYRAG
jgi:hypothetical protein